MEKLIFFENSPMIAKYLNKTASSLPIHVFSVCQYPYWASNIFRLKSSQLNSCLKDLSEQVSHLRSLLSDEREHRQRLEAEREDLQKQLLVHQVFHISNKNIGRIISIREWGKGLSKGDVTRKSGRRMAVRKRYGERKTETLQKLKE